MNRRLYAVLTAALLMAWGCSSDDNDEPQGGGNFTVTPVQPAPKWAVDWTWNSPVPEWQEPDPTRFECSMNMLVELNSDLASYSTNADQMAMFIGGECRGLSYRNIVRDGDVIFLVHVKGTSEEAGQPMELHYYSAGAGQLFTDPNMPPFTPNNVIDSGDVNFQMVLTPAGISTKYPFFTEFSVLLPDNIPFTPSDDDEMAVFVGDECRGICSQMPEAYDGWRGIIYRASESEQAQLRYYSVEKQSIYILDESFVLDDELQTLRVTF